MNQQVRARRMLEWLTFTSPLDKVARALVLDYFLPYGPIESAIWHLSNKDALICLAVYGPSDVIVGVAIPGTIWRNLSEVQLLAAQSMLIGFHEPQSITSKSKTGAFKKWTDSFN